MRYVSVSCHLLFALLTCAPVAAEVFPVRALDRRTSLPQWSLLATALAVCLAGCGGDRPHSIPGGGDASASDIGATDDGAGDAHDAGSPSDADADLSDGARDGGTDAADLGGDAGAALPRDPFPSMLVTAAALDATGFGTIEFYARDGNVLTAHIYRATSFVPDTGPILFVMHGAGRTADSYLRAAAPIAERRDALAIAIEFDEARYMGSESFTLGVGVTDTPEGDMFDSSEWRADSDYTYAEVEHLFEAIRTRFTGTQPGYFIFGHSAGAQFTHRLVTFVPSNRALSAVAANAGWYTLPRAPAGGDPNYAMPYGLLGTPVAADTTRLVESPLTVLVGSRDTMIDGNLRMTAQARAQGNNRFERGQFYFADGESEAVAVGATSAWRFGIAPLAGHDKDEVLPSADFYLFETGSPCTPSAAADAAGLVVNEIHADPDLADGDANADGVRDNTDDEFVELVNNSATPLCLTGWTLGDVNDGERHVFPVNSIIEPGGALIVFGGGVPVGTFGRARVQWAAFGGQLSLTNSGDVISLRDPSGGLVRQVSWGDCATQDCAPDHIPVPLDLNASVTRSPELSGGWVPHDMIHATRYSPGTRGDGAAF